MAAVPQILLFVNVMDTIGEVEGGWDPYYSCWKKLRKFPPRPPRSLSPSLPAPVAAGLPLLLPNLRLLLLLLKRQVSLGIDRGESTWLTGGAPPTPKCADTCSVRDKDKQSRRRTTGQRQRPRQTKPDDNTCRVRDKDKQGPAKTIGQTKSDTEGLCQRQAAFLLKARTNIELKGKKRPYTAQRAVVRSVSSY